VSSREHMPYSCMELQSEKRFDTVMRRLTTGIRSAVAVTGIFFRGVGGGVSTNSVEDRENEDLGAVVL